MDDHQEGMFIVGRLVDFAEVYLGRAPAKTGPDDAKVAVPMLALRDVGSRITVRSELENVDATASLEGVRLAQSGDVVVTARGRLRAAIIEPQHEGVAIGPNLILIRVRDGLPPALVVAFLRHPEVERRLVVETAGTSTPGISIEALRQLEMRIPPAETWAEAAELVDAVEAYHDEIVESARLMKQGVSEWVFDQMAENPS